MRSDRAPKPPPWPALFQGWEAVSSQPPTAPPYQETQMIDAVLPSVTDGRRAT
ncbi:hypothetical protein [Streptomyces cinereoruber]|uniref:hypothetical protein n=1 Tax=Streptomyces cinereoruber TaxID=67260 RepID=UPI00365A723A